MPNRINALTEEELAKEIELAKQAKEEADGIEPRAIDAYYDADENFCLL